MRLGQASTAALNAAIKVTHDNVSRLIDVYMSGGFASMFKNQAKAELESPAGKAWLTRLVDDALDAAAAVDHSDPPTPPPAPKG